MFTQSVFTKCHRIRQALAMVSAVAGFFLPSCSFLSKSVGTRQPGAFGQAGRPLEANLAVTGVLSPDALVGDAGQEIGPRDPFHGFPLYYRDSDGDVVELCYDTDPRCLPPAENFDPALPVSFPENFSEESWFWAAESTVTVGTTGQIVVLFGIEAAFASGSPVPGQQILFGRTRFVGRNLANGVYRITHPYGTHQFDVTAGTIKFVDDVGAAVGDFSGLLKAPFGSLLKWDVDAPAGYLSDFTVPHTFEGSPFGTNFIRVERISGGTSQVVGQTNLATISGKRAQSRAIMAPPPGTYNRFPVVSLTPVFAVPEIYFTVDGSSPVDSPTRELYTAPIDLAAVAARLGTDPSQIQLNTFPVGAGAVVSGGSYVRDPNLIVATATPLTGTYSTAISVSFAIEGPGTEIWYTIDGTDPLSSATRVRYADPIVLSRNGQYQFRYVAVEVGANGTVLRVSSVKSANYAVAVDLLTRTARDPSIDMPFSVTDEAGISLTTCWQAEDPYCLPPGGVDPSLPLQYPSNFPIESFFFAASSSMSTPAGEASLGMALEGAYLTPDIVPGERVLFGRIRIRADLDRAGLYRVTHPYGVEYFNVVSAGRRAINFTEDVTPIPGNLDAFRLSRVTPVLRWASGAPAGYIGDPNVLNSVTGSPYGTNFFKIERLDAPGSYVPYAFSDQFSVSGKLAPALAVSAAPMGGSYLSTKDVLLTSSDPGATIYFTTDGSDPKTSSTRAEYTAPINVTSSVTIRYYAMAAAGIESAVMSDSYAIDLALPVVTVTPDSGIYNGDFTVTMAGSRPGAIWYTTDGSSPANTANAARRLYLAPFLVRYPNSVTIKAIMTDAIGQNSAEVTRSYSFNLIYPIANPPRTSIDERVQLSGTNRLSIPVFIDWRPEESPTTTYRLELSTGGGTSWVNQSLGDATVETFTQYLSAAAG